MKRSLQFLAVLSLGLPPAGALSQATAYVYVASNPKNSTGEITAFSAASDGKLTPIFGSPFRENVLGLAVNGKYLFAVSRSSTSIDTFAIEHGGGLRYLASTNFANHAKGDRAAANQLFFDHTGTDLYVQEFNADGANTGVASFAVNKNSGALTYLGLDITGAFPGDNKAAWFLGNNVYAYSAVNSGCMYYKIYGFKRNSNGLLVSADAGSSLPATPPNVHRYVANLVAADPYNHLAVLMQPANPPGCANGPLQLAVYTANASGALSTASTYATMPNTSISNPYDMKMAPSGKLVAVAGQQGLQVFHFNGANPIKPDTGLLTADPIVQMFWDNANHLYAISQSAGRLHVFTITPTFAHEASGSPYAVNDPGHLIVQPLTQH
jgi:6-phosphogluconolactonase (cycloisomerase 2 family)